MMLDLRTNASTCKAVLHIIHHSDYIVETGGTGTVPHDKYALVMRALGKIGVPMTVHAPEVMPREWLEAIHDPGYVDEVLNCSLPVTK